MTVKKERIESLTFVTEHFKEGALLAHNGWRRFKLSHHFSNFRRNIAAASVAVAVFAATASICYYSFLNPSHTTDDTKSGVVIETPNTAEAKIERIHFQNVPLKDVVAEIERVYGVTITNVPEEQIRVTISYEGTSSEVVETINELFETNLIISDTTN